MADGAKVGTTIAYGNDDALRIAVRDQWFDALDKPGEDRKFRITTVYGADGRVLNAGKGANALGPAFSYSVYYESGGRPAEVRGIQLAGETQPRTYWKAVSQPGPSHRGLRPTRQARGDGGGRSELGYTDALSLTGELVYLKARVYDAGLKRFIQADSVDRLRYAYVWGDPANLSDPTGLMAIDFGLAQMNTAFVESRKLENARITDAQQAVAAREDQNQSLETQAKMEQQDTSGSGLTAEVKGYLAGMLTFAFKTGGEISVLVRLETESGFKDALANWNAELSGLPAQALASGEQGAALVFGALTVQAAGAFVPSAQVPSGVEILYSGSKKAPVPLEGPAAGGGGRAVNSLRPDAAAEGAHSTFKRGPDGKTSNYATYEPNPKNPSGFQEVKRVDVTGRSHRNPDGAIVPTPHVKEAGTKGVRPATPWELP